jgi:hypothetical protein
VGRLYGALVVKKHIRNPRHRAPALVVARDAARCAPLVIYRAAKAVSRGAARCSSGYMGSTPNQERVCLLQLDAKLDLNVHMLARSARH